MVRLWKFGVIIALGSTLAFAQLARNEKVNKIAKNVSDATNKILNKRYGETFSDARLKDPDAIFCFAAYQDAWVGDVLKFSVPKVRSENELESTWMPKVLAVCKKYHTQEAGVKIVIINSGVGRGSLFLTLELATLKHQIDTKD